MCEKVGLSNFEKIFHFEKSETLMLTELVQAARFERFEPVYSR